MLDNAINKVMSKKLLNGYASFIMEQGNFHNWIHLAKESEEVWPWMVSFTEDLLDVKNSRLFDECCRHVMDQLVPFGRDAMMHRENKSADGYEYKLFHFLVSDEFCLICSAMLPTKRMQIIKAAWPIFGRVLGNIFRTWLIDAVRNERRNRDPELFKIRDYARVTNEELKSETNRIMSWAMWSARIKIKDVCLDKYRLLSLVFCQEKDVDEEYVKARYDLTVLLRNIGGNGGMRLVSGEYFDWGVRAMRVVSKELTVADIEIKGSKAFGRAKKAIFNHTSLKSDFALICQHQSSETSNLV